MAVALLDVNVLLALAWPQHAHHGAAHEWFAGQRPEGWATCALTQAGFVRLSSQPGAVKTPVTVSEAIRNLDANVSVPEHEFWPLDYGIAAMLPEIRDRLMGPRQITDALLLDLAIRRGGKLATLDRRVENLLAADSAHRGALEVLLLE
ncbi:MAG: TA system VapC family ribonuclease toxin [Acidobacteriota bacterium]